MNNWIKKQKNVYRFLAKKYDFLTNMFSFVFGKGAPEEFSKLMAQYIKPSDNILDIGVGTGVNIERALKENIRFKSYEGVDLTPEMLEVAKKKFGHFKNVSFKIGNIITMKIHKKYDVILSTLVFSHLENQEKIVEKLLSALNPNGVLLLMFFSDASAKPKSSISSLFHKVYRIIGEPIFKLHYVPSDTLAKFPKAKFEKHVPCWGGTMSTYVWHKTN